MPIDPNNNITLYLLGELPEDEMSAIEARYFAEPPFFDQVLEVETALVDDYARNRLSPQMRERFEAGYMTAPARRERVNFAQALAARLDRSELPEQSPSKWQAFVAFFAGQRPVLAFGMAMGMILIAVSVIWFFNRTTPQEVTQNPARHVEVRPSTAETKPTNVQPIVSPSEQVPATTPTATPKPSPTREIETAPRSVSLVLAMGGVRSGDSSRTQTLNIPRGTAEARLVISLSENVYPAYRLSLKDMSGSEIASRSLSKTKGSNLIMTIPANKLQNGDHVLTLTGVGDDGSADDLSRSLFRVRKN